MYIKGNMSLKIYQNYELPFTGYTMLSFVTIGTIGIVGLIVGESFVLHLRRNSNQPSSSYLKNTHSLDLIPQGNEFSNDSAYDNLESDVLEETYSATSSMIQGFALKVCKLKKVLFYLFFFYKLYPNINKNILGIFKIV